MKKKTKITISPNFYTSVVNSYFRKVVEFEMINQVRKIIKKQSQEIAEAVVDAMLIQIFLKPGIGGEKDTLGTSVTSKYQNEKTI